MRRNRGRRRGKGARHDRIGRDANARRAAGTGSGNGSGGSGNSNSNGNSVRRAACGSLPARVLRGHFLQIEIPLEHVQHLVVDAAGTM
ncbi:hypothetical protein BamIOP4010DRAFT_1032 [Burkholderia ambifaria IOP40-10]|uniref:Uncharacterized protein n=1 Tax=Burkholderia ambifaria IOP40-10 TaxID=396596 RepID=B1FAH3_9BURK|nr:hypothetical protein BamIOP4010DRAFT_1032 [Burkholderia ambifaria IOP40-10]